MASNENLQYNSENDSDSLLRVANRIAILWRNFNPDIMSLSYRGKKEDYPVFEGRLSDQLDRSLKNPDYDRKTMKMPYGVSTLADSFGEHASPNLLLKNLDHVDPKTLYLMRADVSTFNLSQIHAFARSIVPNMGERRLLDKLIWNDSALLLIFSNEDLLFYQQRLREVDNATRYITESNHFHVETF